MAPALGRDRPIAYFRRVRDFINCFRRDSAGRWICVEPCEIDLPGGRIQVAADTVFTAGTLFMDVDVAELLDAQYEKSTPSRQ